MKLARLQTPDGTVEGEYDDGTVTTPEGNSYEVGADGSLLAPCEPGTLYCVGRNFVATLDQMDYDRPEQPDWFIKPAVSVHPPEQPVVYPSWTDDLTYAGELAAVVGETAHDLSGERAVREALRGWTILNDLDALDQPGRTARKAFDGSAPLGPVVETDLNPRSLEMETHVAGRRRQAASTEQMLFDPFETIAFLSERYTFQPGDVIALGSPENPGLIEPGDDVEIHYEGIGTLRNAVVAPGE
jgi:2-keto-4-pentenoate hydratase/2-oxohepta-3-ene-1,7-dioic acid hydratase in catechol pathway